MAKKYSTNLAIACVALFFSPIHTRIEITPKFDRSTSRTSDMAKQSLKLISGLKNQSQEKLNKLDEEKNNKIKLHKISQDLLSKKLQDLIEKNNKKTKTQDTVHIIPLNQELFAANCLALQLIGKLPYIKRIDIYIMQNLSHEDDKNKYQILKTSAKIWLACKLTQLEQYVYHRIIPAGNK